MEFRSIALCCRMTEVANPEPIICVGFEEEPKINYPSNVAPIKKEFLVEAPLMPDAPALMTEEEKFAVREKKKEDRRDRRGMNKDRKKDMARTETKIRASAVRLCPSVNTPDVKCKYGDKCTSEHDIASFLAAKPADIAEKCPVYEANGKCRFSYACRFGNVHLGPNQEQLSKESPGTNGEVRNHHSMHIQMAMRKREYDFGRSNEAVAEISDGGSLHSGAMEWEKRRLDMKSLKGKKYLAPLTTVGNLPFRRLCVDLGAEITCGEMAVATSLLMGTPSEWSLVKRHSSEKIFGVQMAGGYPDSMSKAAQILVDEFDVDFIDVNLGCPIDVVNMKGGGCALAARTNKLIDVLKSMRFVMKDVPLTIKLRTGLKEGELTADKTLRSVLERVPIDLIDFHPRSKEQRYTKLARWDFVERIAQTTQEVPLWCCGDVFSYEDYYDRLEKNPIDGIVIGRGALIKPWIFTEIDEKRHWDITASERIEMLQKFVNYGLDHWGSDDAGVERTRKFLLELLSFQCRYIPVGLLETLPQRINDRPPFYRGRSEMETLLSSGKCTDWVEISKIFLGPPPEQFLLQLITLAKTTAGSIEAWAAEQQQYQPPPPATTKYLETARALEMDATVDWRPLDNGRRSMEGLIGGEGGAPAIERHEPEEGPPNLQDQGAGNNGVAEEEEGREGQPVAYVECYSDWRVLSQTVVIRKMNLLEKSFVVYTQMAVMPLDPNLDSVRLNLGRNCKLPNEAGGSTTFPVAVNDIEASYQRVDPYEGMASSCREKSMAELLRVRSDRLSAHEGELIIYIPPEVRPLIQRQICIKVSLEVYVRNPVDGVQFNVHIGADRELERGAHAFTYRSSLQSSTSEWLPCIDAPDQLSLWTIHFTCEAAHTVVMSAELMECEQLPGGGEKTYHYQQLVPTAPMNMGWAVGHFTPCPHKDMPEMTNFSLPGLASLVSHTTANLDRTFEYLEELLSCRYPFPSFKQCFVDNLPEDVVAYSSFSLVSVNVLYHKKIIDVVQRTRQLLAYSIASQFFSCFISAADFADMWVVRALARYLTSLYVEKVFGRCESLFHSKRMLADLCEFESDWGSVMLRPVNDNVYPMTHAPTGSAQTCSPLYAEQLWQKGELVIRLLAKKLGHEPFFQVLHKMLSVGEQMGRGRRDNPTCWTYLTLTTNAFFRTVHSVTGQEMPTFLEQWVYGGGHASFHINFLFNRKRNMVELDIRQEDVDKPGVMMYTGPLTIVVQELDGCFEHHVQIDSELSRHELQCHSKGRKQKRKKVPLSTGEEVEVDLSNMDPDSPVLWVRVDPNMLLLREMHVRQPSYQWEYLLKYERDALAQMTALDKIQEFPSASSRQILVDTINCEQFFYRVRCRAAFALSTVHNKMAEVSGGRPPLISLFAQKFGCKSAPQIPRSNNFLATSSNLQTYFLMQALPQGIGRMRNKHNMALTEAHSFLLDLLYYNDNSTNRYADDHYRASLLTSLSSTIVPPETLMGDVTNPASMTTDVSVTLRELTLALNMDTLRPSFGRVVGIAALFGIYQLQKTGIIPVDATLFWKFAHKEVFVGLRRASLWILVDRLAHRSSALSSHDDLIRLIRLAIDDDNPGIRRYVAELLARRPPFETTQCAIGPALNALNTARVAEQLWAFITAPRTESRVRSLLCDVWFCMYGWGVPPVLGGVVDAVGLPERRSAPVGRRIEERTPEPLRGWHSSDVVLEKRDSGSAAPLEDRNDDEILQ